MSGRGQCRRIISLKCSACYEKHVYRWITNDYAPHLIEWHNVEAYKTERGSIRCKCKTCGHDWPSKARLARSAVRI